MPSISTLSLGIPVRSPTLIGLDFSLTTLVGIAEKRKQFLTCTQKTTRVMRASLPLYHLPLMTLLVVLMFSINPMIYVLDQLQEHVPSYWNNR
jgi:hypothetical protein